MLLRLYILIFHPMLKRSVGIIIKDVVIVEHYHRLIVLINIWNKFGCYAVILKSHAV